MEDEEEEGVEEEMKKRSYECDKKVKGLYSFGKSNKHLIKLLTFFPLFIPLSVVHTV